MSEYLFKFLLSELRTVRVRCKQCNSVIELAPGALKMTFAQGVCPACRRGFHAIGTANGEIYPAKFLEDLQGVLEAGIAFAKQIEIEFTLPTEPPSDK